MKYLLCGTAGGLVLWALLCSFTIQWQQTDFDGRWRYHAIVKDKAVVSFYLDGDPQDMESGMWALWSLAKAELVQALAKDGGEGA